MYRCGLGANKGAAAQGAWAGAQAGSSLGPIGMVVGAVAGGLTSLFGQSKPPSLMDLAAEERARRLKQEKRDAAAGMATAGAEHAFVRKAGLYTLGASVIIVGGVLLLLRSKKRSA